MRSSAWTGAITLSLVAVLVRPCPATEGSPGRSRTSTTPPTCRIRYRKFCEVEDRELAGGEIVRGQERGGGMVALTDEDMEQRLSPRST
ncbi:Ku protein [Streptacidiphilus anmyonensis]|uniref:Ku protein n=1 Tax=Streptacidiphilus anmyonensis TaxID=405782 RepID=UPI0005AA5684|nr:Ku protein [Streptacidiphilus anmyonensis]